MSATHEIDSNATHAPTLYLAFELGWSTWNLAFCTGPGRKPRLRSIPARNLPLLTQEIQRARQRFGLPDDTPVVSCYEAAALPAAFGAEPVVCAGFGAGNARARKVGILALARKLLVALWKYVERGEVPAGAEVVPWQKKLNGRLPARMKSA